MPRRYDSSKRLKAAEQTRQDIVRAALRLHWEGITGFGPLAREAGCSLPTLRKHYPNKEALFHECTRTFAETLAMPDLAALGAIDEPARRLEQSVSELCRIHEAMMGYAWLAAHQRSASPILDAEMRAYDGLADAIAGIIAPVEATRAPAVRGFLDFLAYRALRRSGGLSPDEAREAMIALLHPLVAQSKSTTCSTERPRRAEEHDDP